ncbi:MAG: tyrosine-type recombinase/integrase [Gammaproteobacteria bacterium]|nr:tyrosine-type recombinase/integrase [Gammaproteobacteria bacterium]
MAAVILPRPIAGQSLSTRATRNPASVYLASLQPTGRRAMAGRLKTVAELLGYTNIRTVPWHALRYEHATAIRARLQELGKAPTTVNATLYALRGIARAAFNLGLMTAEDYQRLRDVRPVKGERLPAGRALSRGEIAALMAACTRDKASAGIRDAALIGIMYCAGLPRAEIVALDLQHCTLGGDTAELKVQGKGNKERLVYLDNGAHDALEDWLRLREDSSGVLFVPINKGSRIQPQRMTEQAVYNVLRKRAREAGIKTFSPHDLRRSFIGDLLDAGADIATVQKLAGHANVSTTAKYDRRGEQAKKKAVKLLHIPYQSQGGHFDDHPLSRRSRAQELSSRQSP